MEEHAVVDADDHLDRGDTEYVVGAVKREGLPATVTRLPDADLDRGRERPFMLNRELRGGQSFAGFGVDMDGHAFGHERELLIVVLVDVEPVNEHDRQL